MSSATVWIKKINDHPTASAFTKKVWKAMLSIPKGEVRSYTEIARMVGSPRAARAVGNACNQNPFAPHVPCHRVVASNGLGGYALGLAKKKRLLKSEGFDPAILEKKARGEKC